MCATVFEEKDVKYFKNCIDILNKGINVTDERKIISYDNSISVECKYLYPQLTFDYLVHDGTTSGSEGNSNGLIEQGEKIELEILPMNNGDFDAEDVYLSLSCTNPGIIIRSVSKYDKKRTSIVGNIPARSSTRSIFIPMNSF